ncbi:hypothetical protein CARUB_v10018452mg, partial [Capsella rubella]
RLMAYAAYPKGSSKYKCEKEYWYDEYNTTCGFKSMIGMLEVQGNGIMVNGEVKIVAEVDVLEVICQLDVLEETQGLDISVFQLQVQSVNSLFEKYPGFASKLCPKNSHLQKTYLNVVLNLTEILCKSSEELSNGDLADAYSAQRFVTNAGFKLDWLEKKLKDAGKTRLHEIEQELKDLNLKCADMEALVMFLR